MEAPEEFGKSYLVSLEQNHKVICIKRSAGGLGSIEKDISLQLYSIGRQDLRLALS